jgi:hypothetical protein
MSFLWRKIIGNKQNILYLLRRRPGEATARGEKNEKDKANAPQLFSSNYEESQRELKE